MTTEIKVPPLGESVAEAIVARWIKSAGEAVALDEPVAELETDKVTLEVPAPAAGVLTAISAEVGASVEVNGILGLIDESAEATASAAPAAPVAPAAPAAPAASVAPAAPAASPAPAVPAAPAAQVAPASSQDMPLSPAVKRLVEENNLDPRRIAATGKDGRLTKGDVLAAIAAGGAKAPSPSPSPSPATPAAPAAASAPAPVAPRVDQPREERVPMTRLRKVIAQRLKDAQNTAAMLTTFNEVDMSAVMALRSEYRDVFEKSYGVRLGFMSFFVQAAIEALKEFPAVNAEIHGEDIIYKNYYNIGVAVGTPQGLVVPVLKDADQMSFAETEASINNFGAKARDGQLTMDDMSGGTFTISNGGVYGSMMSTPILNKPQSGILGMHNIQKRAVVVSGKGGDTIEIRPMMYLALSYDHRIIDGREAVSFLVRIKNMI
ncbi:MAG: 2-oxoglutarate dehydrogenase complex dihydrolipoyllysine-residue succinyltransferase, partial [Alphaproteobacteria bacterium]|nr:2-oxoglutarate dehydrogenase complex dihydrolipoyllysine-residue succinyltransferase [Alphaproteobacteria bacterium]